MVVISGDLLFWKRIICSDNWENGVPLDLSDPRILAMAAAERHFLEADYDDYSESNSSGAAFCRSAALIVSFSSIILSEREREPNVVQL